MSKFRTLNLMGLICACALVACAAHADERSSAKPSAHGTNQILSEDAPASAGFPRTGRFGGKWQHASLLLKPSAPQLKATPKLLEAPVKGKIF